MEIGIKIRFYTDSDPWLCFACAVKAALAGEKVEIEIDDYSSDYVMYRTWCLHMR